MNTKLEMPRAERNTVLDLREQAVHRVMRKVVSRAAVSTAPSRAEVLTAQRIVVFFGVFLFFSRASKRAVSTAPSNTLPASSFAGAAISNTHLQPQDASFHEL